MKTRSLLRPRAAAVLALVERALLGEVEAVHDFRVAARSLRAALRTLARDPRGRAMSEARRSLQRAIRLLADPRDRDVGRSLLLKRAAALEDGSAQRRRILGLMASDRRVALARCESEWPRDLAPRLVDLVSRKEPALRTVLRRTRAEAFRERGRALALVALLGRRYDPVRLHDLRRRIRSLRYALEDLAGVEHGAQTKVVLLKPLQSALGDIQDRVVLSRWLKAQAWRFRRSDPALASELREAARRAKAGSIEAHRRFLSLAPGRTLERLALHVDPREGTPLGVSVPRRPARRPQARERPRMRRAAQAAP